MRTVQLGEVCEFVYGNSLKEERRRPGKVPVFGSNGIVGWHDQATTSGPAIVIGRKGSIGEINWSNDPCFPIDTTYFVEKTKQPCDLRWLYFTLQKLDLTRLNKSAAIPGLNREDAYRQRIPWPDFSEQKRIAALLEQAERLRRTRRYAIELSDTFLPAVFVSLFGNRAKNSKYPRASLGELIVSGPQNGLYKPATAYGSGTRIVRIDAYRLRHRRPVCDPAAGSGGHLPWLSEHGTYRQRTKCNRSARKRQKHPELIRGSESGINKERTTV